MKLYEYIQDKIMVILGQLLGMFLLSFYLLVTGYAATNTLLIIVLWGMVFLLYLLVEYYGRRKQFAQIDALLKELDKPYLLAEVMQVGHNIEDRKYRDVLRASNKSVIEKIHQVEEDRNEYKEFIESWVHEIKTPLTVLQLICENQKDATSRKILSEAAKVEQYIDTALFYARADKVYQDYMIRKTEVKGLVTTVLMKNKKLLIENGMSCTIDIKDTQVPCDAKWVEFILNQIVINAVKYRREQGGTLTFSIEERENLHQRCLVIMDNGIGIKEEELPRVFDKGFTGSNGRSKGKATGIGLYLCKRLCDKLGMGIKVESKEGEYTKVSLLFPYLERLL